MLRFFCLIELGNLDFYGQMIELGDCRFLQNHSLLKDISQENAEVVRVVISLIIIS